METHICSKKFPGDPCHHDCHWRSNMSKDEVEKDKRRKEERELNVVTEPPGTGTIKRSMISEEQRERLLPGFSDDITLDHISPKLSWRDFFTLALVSHGWRQAIQSHQVYDARVRSESTETLVVLDNVHSHPLPEDTHGIALYSMREKSCYDLPPIPHLRRRFPFSCQCIVLDGKVYILGGVLEPSNDLGSDEVYVLDLVGQGHWKRCAGMQTRRRNFGAGVLDGKIYVFGGTPPFEPICESEVYDPKVNSWSTIKPMSCWRHDLEVSTVGGELVVYGGYRYDSESVLPYKDAKWIDPEQSEDDNPLNSLIEVVLELEVYNPVTDEWRLIKTFQGNSLERVFVARGKFHFMTDRGIYVHDIDQHSWTLVQSYSFSVIGPIDSVLKWPLTTLVVDDELLVVVYWIDRGNEYKGNTGNRTSGICLLQSKGFDSENKEILWEETDWSLSFGELSTAWTRSMSPIQL